MENENPGILFFWKARLQEFSFCGKREFGNLWKTRILVLCRTRIREFSFCGKPELENFLFLENQNPRIPVLWKTRLREFSFYGKEESGDLWKKKKEGSGAVRRCAEGDRRLAALCGKKKIQVRILVLWKTRIGEFSFSGKRDSKNSRFVKN